MSDHRARHLVHLGMVLSLALGAASCSTMSDVGDSIASMDPTGLLGGDSTEKTPDLADVPPAPDGATAADQQQVASAVTADGNKAQYSADALRAGTEAAAPPPTPAEATPSVAQQALAAAPPPPSMPAPSAAAPSAVASAAPPVADAPPSADAAPSAEPPSAAPSAASGPMRVAAVPPGPGASASPVGGAAASPVGVSNGRPSGAEPAVPPGTGIRSGMMTAPVLSDAQLGFKPSSAPPLNSSINQWVSQPILNHYRQTASLSSRIGANPNAAVPSGGSATPINAYGGLPATSTVLFAGDGTALSAAGRAQVRSAVSAFKANGGSGTVRVVGHASSRTANMAVDRHLALIFEKSQKRASAVAQELIHQGVPAGQVVVEAVGDSQPVYYESMPRGEDGNRRAEIFVQ